MRRCSFALEFRKFNAGTRLKALQVELGRRGLEGYFTECELADLCGAYDVNADGIVKVVETLEIGQGVAKDTVLSEIRTVLGNHEKATSGRRKPERKPNGLENYTLNGLHPSHRLEDMVAVIQRQAELPPGESKRPVTLLLYGRSGSTSRRICFTASMPSDPGMMMSIRTMWGR